MLISTALMRSLCRIATRRVPRKGFKDKFQYEFAVAPNKGMGLIYIIHGNTGFVRRLEAVDQLRTDWEPFQEVPDRHRKLKKVTP